jgi:hypothetical protein
METEPISEMPLSMDEVHTNDLTDLRSVTQLSYPVLWQSPEIPTTSSTSCSLADHALYTIPVQN